MFILRIVPYFLFFCASFRYFSDTSCDTNIQATTPNGDIINLDSDILNGNVTTSPAFGNKTALCAPKFPRGRRSTCTIERQTTIEGDVRLNDWLIRHSIDRDSRNMILNEDFTFDDFCLHMEKDDLLRIGLRCGVEVRLWTAVGKYRQQLKNDVAIEESIGSATLVGDITANNIRLGNLGKSHSNSNCNSLDSNTNTTNSSDYESCNGFD